MIRFPGHARRTRASSVAVLLAALSVAVGEAEATGSYDDVLRHFGWEERASETEGIRAISPHETDRTRKAVLDILEKTIEGSTLEG
jgi:hypothetical protein